jgi:hypothetical protein
MMIVVVPVVLLLLLLPLDTLENTTLLDVVFHTSNCTIIGPPHIDVDVGGFTITGEDSGGGITTTTGCNVPRTVPTGALVVAVVTGAIVGALVGIAVGAFVGADVGVLVGAADGALVGLAVGGFVGFAVGGFVGVAVGALVGDAVGIFIGGAVGTRAIPAGAFVGLVTTIGAVALVPFKNGAKFHFGPMYLQPFFPYSILPGQSVSSPALFAGPFPHWMSLYRGRLSMPGPLPRRVQTSLIVFTPRGVSTTIGPIS